MSQTYTLEFRGVTASTIAKLKTELAKSAKLTTDPNGDFDISGTGPAAGIEAEAQYDISNQVLSVSILDKPWYVTVTNIRQQIESALERVQRT